MPDHGDDPSITSANASTTPASPADTHTHSVTYTLQNDPFGLRVLAHVSGCDQGSPGSAAQSSAQPICAPGRDSALAAHPPSSWLRVPKTLLPSGSDKTTAIFVPSTDACNLSLTARVTCAAPSTAGPLTSALTSIFECPDHAHIVAQAESDCEYICNRAEGEFRRLKAASLLGRRMPEGREAGHVSEVFKPVLDGMFERRHGWELEESEKC